MSANNPHERRRDRRAGEMHPLVADLSSLTGSVDCGPRESPLRFEDLEALVAQVGHRTRREEAARHERLRQEAQRIAWDDGHAVGVGDGRDELLLDIDRQHGDRARGVQLQVAELLAALERDHRKVTKSDVAAMLSECQAVLMRLLNAHHL